jgi:hypothetical protein
LSRTSFRAAAALLAAITLCAIALTAFARPDGDRPRRPARARGGPLGPAADAVHAPSREESTRGEILDTTDVYRGLGTWIDIYDVAWEHPGAYVRKMAARGIRTLYLQTSNHSRGRPFVHPEGAAAFLDAAERHGIRTVAWYLPGFRDIELDLKRSLAAVRFRTPAGNVFDSFAMDIESPEVVRVSARTDRTMRLSERLRRIVGEHYPLGAIIPSPLRMEVDPRYWPRFPYRGLARLYDVILPMTYFTFRVNGGDGAHAYTTGNIDIIRRETGDRSVPIHVIGGIGANREETAGFVRAVRERGIIGASFYTFPLTPRESWEALRLVRPNPVQRPALPVPLPFDGPLGNVPDEETTHPKEVVFRVDGRRGRYRVSYEAFDLDTGEVSILVNWTRVGVAEPTLGHDWGDPRTVAIPRRVLHPKGVNYISFVAQGQDPDWSTWGVRAVRLVRPGRSRSTVAATDPRAA